MVKFQIVSKGAYIAAVLTAAMFAAPAQALVIFGDTAKSTEHTGSTFTADLTYSFSNPSSGTLSIDLTNQTPAAVGGFLTAFVLNNPEDKISSATLSTSPTCQLDASWAR